MIIQSNVLFFFISEISITLSFLIRVNNTSINKNCRDLYHNLPLSIFTNNFLSKKLQSLSCKLKDSINTVKR